MGRNSLTDMLEHASPNQALTWHLSANLYPPPPASMREPALAAITACNEGDHDRSIQLPNGVTHRGNNHAPAHALIEGFHLEAFLDEVNDAFDA